MGGPGVVGRSLGGGGGPQGNRCGGARKGEWPVRGTQGVEAAVVSGLGGFQSERWGGRESPVLTPGVFTALVDLVPGISAAGEERCWGHGNPGTNRWASLRRGHLR